MVPAREPLTNFPCESSMSYFSSNCIAFDKSGMVKTTVLLSFFSLTDSIATVSRPFFFGFNIDQSFEPY